MNAPESTSCSSIISTVAAVIAVAATAYNTLGHHSHAAQIPSVAFVDMQAVLQQSEAGKSIHNQVAPRQDKIKQAAEEKLKDLKRQQDGLGSLNEPQKSEKAAALQKQINDWNAEAEKRQAALNAAVNPVAQQMDKVLHEQIQAIASEYSYSAVLPMQSAVYVGTGVDVTAETIRRMDEKLPSVTVQFDDAKK